MAAVTRAKATAQVRRTIAAYRDRVHEVRNDTDRLPPAGARQQSAHPPRQHEP